MPRLFPTRSRALAPVLFALLATALLCGAPGASAARSHAASADGSTRIVKARVKASTRKLEVQVGVPCVWAGRARVTYVYRVAGRKHTRSWIVRARNGALNLRAGIGRYGRKLTARRGTVTVTVPRSVTPTRKLRTTVPYVAPSRTAPAPAAAAATDPAASPASATAAAPQPDDSGAPPAPGGLGPTGETTTPAQAPADTPPVVTPPAATPPAGAGKGADIGLFEDVQYLTGDRLAQRLDAYKAAGAKWVRFQMIWSGVQSQGPAYYDWKPYDDLLSGMAARGLKPLAVLGSTPAWARRSDCSDNTPACAPADPNRFAQFAGEAAARYKGTISNWEIWNEPNNPIFWKPAPDAGAYAQLLQATHDAIHAADPGANVITGGTAPAVTGTDGRGRYWISPTDFLTAIYRSGGRDSFDAVGVHPYTFPRMPSSTSKWSAWYEVFGTTTNIRGLMVANHDAGKKIWGTEFGAHTDPAGEGYMTEAQQARLVTEGSRMWGSYDWAGPLMFYSYIDRGTDTRDRENFFGLVRYDGTPKPALEAFRNAALGLDRTDDPAADPSTVRAASGPGCAEPAAKL